MAKAMTLDEVSALERRVQLGNPDEVRLPDGRTVSAARGDFVRAGREEAAGNAETELEAMRRQTSAVLPEGKVEVAVTPAGQIVASASAPAPETTAEEAEGASDLPEGFPLRQLLIDSGYGTIATLSAASDEQLIAIEGVGEAKLKQIKKALK